MIEVINKGGWESTTSLLTKILNHRQFKVLDRFGKAGVAALQSATPVDTGTTASMWRYEIAEGRDGLTISFHNDNINQYVNIAIILQYGHGTGTGGWVEGRDYINPAIQPVFDEMAEELWKEVMGK